MSLTSRAYYRLARVQVALSAALFLRELLRIQGWGIRLALGTLCYGLLGLLWWALRRCYRAAARRP